MNSLTKWFDNPTDNQTEYLPIYANPKEGADYILFDSAVKKDNEPIDLIEERSVFLSNDIDLNSQSDLNTYIPESLRMGTLSDGVYTEEQGFLSVYAFEGGYTLDINNAVAGKNSFSDVIEDDFYKTDINISPTLDVYLTNSTNGDAYFLHDTFNDYFENLALEKDALGEDFMPRFNKLNSLYAGDGDDIIDLTSTEKSKIGENSNAGGGITNIYGGDGKDIITGADGNVYGEDGDLSLIHI